MDHVRKGYRASKVKSHLIFYRITNDIVEIIRILHERMDIDNRLADYAQQLRLHRVRSTTDRTDDAQNLRYKEYQQA